MLLNDYKCQYLVIKCIESSTKSGCSALRFRKLDVKNENDNNNADKFLWQSFITRYETSHEFVCWFLSSRKSFDNPAKGYFTLELR